MEQNSLTKSDLARILGVSRGQATNIVNGHRAISKDVAKKLSKHFKLDIAVFLD
jgi:plasmid maintenance system antidote protein VapI